MKLWGRGFKPLSRCFGRGLVVVQGGSMECSKNLSLLVINVPGQLKDRFRVIPG